ncbi:MAG TPA: hypothetical protein VF109_05505, partial [Mycobacteriales bacterium]
GEPAAAVEATGDGAATDRPATPAAAAAGAGPDPAEVAARTAPSAPASAVAATAVAERPEAESIDLLEAAGGAVAKRVVPVLGIALLLAILVTVIRRRR